MSCPSLQKGFFFCQPFFVSFPLFHPFSKKRKVFQPFPKVFQGKPTFPELFLTKMVFLKRYKVFRRKTCVPSFSTGQVPKTCVPSFSLGQVPKTCVLTKTTFLKGHKFSSGKPSFSPLFFEKGQGRDTRLENLCPYLSRRKGRDTSFLTKTTFLKGHKFSFGKPKQKYHFC